MLVAALIRLIEQLEMEQVLVFCRTNLDCDNLEKFLASAGGDDRYGAYTCSVLAGMRSMQDRRKVRRSESRIKSPIAPTIFLTTSIQFPVRLVSLIAGSREV